jgi:hypothetical protein
MRHMLQIVTKTVCDAIGFKREVRLSQLATADNATHRRQPAFPIAIKIPHVLNLFSYGSLDCFLCVGPRSVLPVCLPSLCEDHIRITSNRSLHPGRKSIGMADPFVQIFDDVNDYIEPHTDDDVRKKRRLDGVKCDRCRSDKQKVIILVSRYIRFAA